MEIMCLMGLFPKEYESEIVKNSRSSMQNAANKLQWGIVNGLDAQPDTNVKICNSLYIGAFPKRYRKLKVPTFAFEHSKNAEDINVGFLNIPLLKHTFRYFGVKRYLSRWAKKNDSSERLLLVYALTKSD